MTCLRFLTAHVISRVHHLFAANSLLLLGEKS
jgi:hypothetical protein